MASAIASRSRRAAARCLRVCAARQDRDAIALAILQQAIGRQQQGRVAKDGVEGKVIQELAGHADLTTTMRYMHLAKGSKEAAIAVLDGPAKKNWRPSGDPDSWLKHPEENQEERWRPHRDSNSTERANHNPATTHAKAEFARESEGADRQERLDRP